MCTLGFSRGVHFDSYLFDWFIASNLYLIFKVSFCSEGIRCSDADNKLYLTYFRKFTAIFACRVKDAGLEPSLRLSLVVILVF